MLLKISGNNIDHKLARIGTEFTISVMFEGIGISFALVNLDIIYTLYEDPQYHWWQDIAILLECIWTGKESTLFSP